jgi:acetolactate synthase small subunit
VKGNWTFEEDKKIIEYVAEKGKKWSKMKAVLENKRTEHMIKNRYHSLITRNKVHRYEKEHQISRRLIEKFEEMQKSQMI